ncbi:MAG: hypothetical protein ACR2L4_00620 [Actinomycetota bacterium]
MFVNHRGEAAAVTAMFIRRCSAADPFRCHVADTRTSRGTGTRSDGRA